MSTDYCPHCGMEFKWEEEAGNDEELCDECLSMKFCEDHEERYKESEQCPVCARGSPS